MNKLMIVLLLSAVSMIAMAEPWKAEYFEEVAKVGTAKSVVYLSLLVFCIQISSAAESQQPKARLTRYTAFFAGAEGSALTVERRKNNNQWYLCGGLPKTCLNLVD